MTAAVKTHHAVLGVLRVSLAGLGLDKTDREARDPFKGAPCVQRLRESAAEVVRGPWITLALNQSRPTRCE